MMVYDVMALKESKLNLQMAGEQKRLAQSSKREAGATKGISLLGAVFLPGAFLAVSSSHILFDKFSRVNFETYSGPSFQLLSSNLRMFLISPPSYPQNFGSTGL